MEKKLIKELFEFSVKKKKIDSCSPVKIEFLTGDASHRKYYRIFSHKSSFIACLDIPFKKGDFPLCFNAKGTCREWDQSPLPLR